MTILYMMEMEISSKSLHLNVTASENGHENAQ